MREGRPKAVGRPSEAIRPPATRIDVTEIDVAVQRNHFNILRSPGAGVTRVIRCMVQLVVHKIDRLTQKWSYRAPRLLDMKPIGIDAGPQLAQNDVQGMGMALVISCSG